jgi:rhodanese-related sulfurtransferase
LHVVVWLRERGLENCYSVAGGIDRWSRELDPAIPRY